MLPELVMAAAMSLPGGVDAAGQNAAHSYLALGDSYTIGEGATDAQRWPVQLAQKLRAAGVHIDAPQIIARTGWTTDELANAMDAATLHPPYALVTLLIGVNNQYRGRDPANYADEFHALLQRAVQLAGNQPQHVIVLSIPDWGVTRFGQNSGRDVATIAREIDAYNRINRDESARQRVHYVDITPATRRAGADAAQLMDDGLHPSAAMYAQWVEPTYAAAKSAF